MPPASWSIGPKPSSRSRERLSRAEARMAAKLFRMWRALRTAVTWLIALALPLQGLAAATMLSCGPGHHRMAAVTAAEPVVDDHAAHENHAAAAASAKHHTGSSGSADDPSKSLHELAKFKCSACAACCVATLLPSAGVTFDPPKQTAQLVWPALVPSAQFLTSGPERPPRLPLV